MFLVPARLRWAFLLVTALSIGFVVAWQNPPPLSLAARAEPAVADSGGTVAFTVSIANTGQGALDDLEVTVTLPLGTSFDRAAADNQRWDIDMVARTVRFRATGPFPAQASDELVIEVVVRRETGQSIVLDQYGATAQGFEQPIAGAPLTVRVGAATTRTPPVTQTAAPSPTATATQTPVATQTAEPSPTPTITVVAAELPPTPTPNLSSEQEVVGTVTVLIFVSLVVGVTILVVVWIVRNAKGA